MAEFDVLNKSVTYGDYADNPGGAFYLRSNFWSREGFLPPSLAGLEQRESDYVTIATLNYESLWAGAVAIAITKVSSLSWEVEGDIPLRTRRGHDLLMEADAGRGWVSFISKLLQDFLLTNNGAFVEVVRQTSSADSQIIGLIPLDSTRCIRTGDPEIPVTYRDVKGRVHELQAHEILEFADMPSTRATMYGTGLCAAARAYSSIYKLACIETYISDKTSGRRPLAVHLINGLNAIQLRSILETAQSEADARGIISYMGAIMATVPGETTPGLATVPLADFPDNFDRRDELDISALSYANNLGLDVQDIQPLTGRALGTGAQSEVLNEKAKGKGLSAFRQQFVHAINNWVLPDLTTMVFVEKDWRDRQAQASYNKTVGEYVASSIDKGVLTPAQGLQVMVDEDAYPKEFLPVDQTADTAISDIEKPEDGSVEQPNASAPVDVMESEEEPIDLASLRVPKVEPLVLAEKSKYTEDLLDETEDEAMKLVRKIRKELANG